MDLLYLPTALFAVALLLGMVGAGSVSRQRYVSGGLTCGAAVAVLLLTSHWALNLQLERHRERAEDRIRLGEAVESYCGSVKDDWDRSACRVASERLSYTLAAAVR